MTALHDIAAEADDLCAEADRETYGDPKTQGSQLRLRRFVSGRWVTYCVPALALLLAIGAGYLKWIDSSAHELAVARDESVQAATEGTIAVLSYQPDTAERDLNAARDRLTGDFRDSYTSLIRDVVIPGAKQKQISAMANVSAAASVSVNDNHAVVLAFVNQTITIGDDPPTNTASSVRINLDRIYGRWLISAFDPI